jgi:phosphotransferase system IIA component
MHIGIDTVKLSGEGFKSLVKVGDKVKHGQLLIEFDIDLLAIKAASLITVIIILNNEKEIQITSLDFVNSTKVSPYKSNSFDRTACTVKCYYYKRC